MLTEIINRRSAWTGILGAVTVAVALLSAGCDSDRKSAANEACGTTNDCAEGLSCVANKCVAATTNEEGEVTGTEERVISGKNENCDTRVDCEPGLACIGRTCVVPDAAFEPTGKECEAINCRTYQDCCNPPQDGLCDSYKSDCDAGNLGGCNAYDYYCACSEGSSGTIGWECTADDRCVFHKTCDPETFGDCTAVPDGAFQCSASGVCVNCESDLDCGTDQTCTDGVCVECSSDADCGSGSCNAAGQCETDRECWNDKNCGSQQTCNDEGKCVERGCTADRECADLYNSYEATCGEDGKCTVPCELDAECNPGGLYNGSICHEGTCVEAGCETDSECMALNGGSGLIYQCVEPTAG